MSIEQEVAGGTPMNELQGSSIIREETITVMEVRELATDVRVAQKEEYLPVPVPVREIEFSLAEKLDTSADDFISMLTMPCTQGKRNLTKYCPGTCHCIIEVPFDFG